MKLLTPFVPLLALAFGCGLDPARIPDHALFADDGATISADGPVSFAVLGNTRGNVPGIDKAAGRSGHGDDVTPSIIADVSGRMANVSGPAFVVLLGDTVRSSSTAEWKRFDQQFAHLLARPAVEGQAAAEGLATAEGQAATGGLPGVPVAGTHEAQGDPRYRGWEGAWPEVGAHIGYNRVGSWYSFDLKTQGTTWRFLVLDSGKAHLGSRWNEQMAWIRGAVDGKYDGIIILMHDSLVDLAGREVGMNPDNAPAELIEKVEDETGLLKIRAIITAGHNANQVSLPGGPFGALQLGAGGGGAPADDLRRWVPGDQAGILSDIQLEPMFDLSLMNALDRWNRDNPVPDLILDKAKAKGSFTGFTGTYDATWFPTYGWWRVTLNGPVIDAQFRQRLPDGTFVDRHRLRFDPGNGWRAAG